MRVLALFAVVQALLQLQASVLTSIGRPDVVLRLQSFSTVGQVAGFFVAVHFGIVWVASSYVVCAYLMSPFWLRAVRRMIGVTIGEQIRTFTAPLFASAVMITLVILAESILRRHLNSAESLALLLPIGILTYLLGIGIVGRHLLREGFRYAVDMRSAKPGGQTSERVTQVELKEP
jgi:O-antigen/teichoic acid export membrane protein